jgi:hypothetical protein
VYDFDHWIEAQRDHRLFGAEAPKSISQLTKVQTISTLYFPDLEPAIARLERGARGYTMWFLDTQKGLGDPSTNVFEGHE